MKRKPIVLAILMVLFAAYPAFATTGHEATGHSTGSTNDSKSKGFQHEMVVDGVRSQFQIMSLASMKMTDDQGATHHIMVKLIDDKSQAEIKTALGKIKVIGPDGAEQVGTLKNYSGIFAANFTFNQAGKYGVICLFKVDGQKKLAKFWYHHQS